MNRANAALDLLDLTALAQSDIGQEELLHLQTDLGAAARELDDWPAESLKRPEDIRKRNHKQRTNLQFANRHGIRLLGMTAGDERI